MKKIPSYQVVYNTIKKNILDEVYEVGSFLPPEPVLEKNFNVSRTTIRKAIDMLSNDGFVMVKQGLGTIVLDSKIIQNINMVTSITETLIKRGYNVSTKSMHIDKIKVTQHIREIFGLEENSEVIRIQRIQLADDKPIAIMKNYLTPDLVPEILKNKHKFVSLYNFLEKEYGIFIDEACDHISAKGASFEQAQMLDVEVGTALLIINRVCYRENKPVCIDDIKLIGDKYEFEINLKGRI